MTYIFRKAEPAEARVVYEMVAERIKWMDEKRLNHWNKVDYLNLFPLRYYEEHLDSLYVLADADRNQVVCASMLYEEDKSWDMPEPAFYVHQLVSSLDASGLDTGRIYLENAEKLAKEQGKSYIRLDSSEDNIKLAEYYTRLGFKAAGSCIRGKYRGVLRQKRVSLEQITIGGIINGK